MPLLRFAHFFPHRFAREYCFAPPDASVMFQSEDYEALDAHSVGRRVLLFTLRSRGERFHD